MPSLHEQPLLTVADPLRYQAVKSAIHEAFSPPQAAAFLKSVERAGLRIRDYEAVLGRGLVGDAARAAYDSLGNSDQGQLREFYLASLERIPPILRDKFFKLYAYY